MTARNESGDLEGSSPHTRGAPRRPRGSVACPRIIPAYAGSTPSSPSTRRTPRDHPRIRGEHTVAIDPRDDWEGSSPHTRGAPRHEAGPHDCAGIIPAYAGSTKFKPKKTTDDWDHPRIRGEHTVAIDPRDDWEGSSPHTRGARNLLRKRRKHRGIIPAYAGSTEAGRPRSSASWDHPRIRGEHSHMPCRSRSRAGSSPHTRGAQ